MKKITLILICLLSFQSLLKANIIVDEIYKKYKLDKQESIIYISISNQNLYIINNMVIIGTYSISSSKYGIGSKPGSNKTPLGLHKIYKKIGESAEYGSIFKARKNTNKIAKITIDNTDTEDDHVTSRILWLKGMEKTNLSSKKRFIYIHGTSEEGLIGKPASHGCIRMNNKDVIKLFAKVDKDTPVIIN